MTRQPRHAPMLCNELASHRLLSSAVHAPGVRRSIRRSPISRSMPNRRRAAGTGEIYVAARTPQVRTRNTWPYSEATTKFPGIPLSADTEKECAFHFEVTLSNISKAADDGLQSLRRKSFIAKCEQRIDKSPTGIRFGCFARLSREYSACADTRRKMR